MRCRRSDTKSELNTAQSTPFAALLRWPSQNPQPHAISYILIHSGRETRHRAASQVSHTYPLRKRLRSRSPFPSCFMQAGVRFTSPCLSSAITTPHLAIFCTSTTQPCSICLSVPYGKNNALRSRSMDVDLINRTRHLSMSARLDAFYSHAASIIEALG